MLNLDKKDCSDGDHSGKAKPLELKVEQGDLAKVRAPHPLKVKLEQGDSSEVKAPLTLKVKLEQGDSGKEKSPDPLMLRLEQDDRQCDHADVGKSNVAEAFDDHISLVVDLPENTTCLMDCEAVDIMKRYQERMMQFFINMPTSFETGLEYAQSNRLYDDPQTVKQILEPLKQHGVSDGELCMIANLRLESVDEVLSIVPSLKTKKSKLIVPLENVVAELAKVRRAA